jgi:hypothetical protein
MFVRRSLRPALSAIGAAAVLVAGIDLTSYAATGRTLILHGRSVSSGTTTVENTGPGPALALITRKSAPPLSVTSGRLVQHLNAAKVGGRTSAQLEPRLLTYRVGRAGAVLPSGEHFVSVPAPLGSFRVSISGLWQSDTPGDRIQCIVVDPEVFRDGDLAKVFAEVNAVEGETNGQALDQVQYVDIRGARKLTLGCDTTGDVGVVSLGQPVTFTFARTRPVVHRGQPSGVPRSFLAGRPR